MRTTERGGDCPSPSQSLPAQPSMNMRYLRSTDGRNGDEQVCAPGPPCLFVFIMRCIFETTSQLNGMILRPRFSARRPI
jgi:hypothetical protein